MTDTAASDGFYDRLAPVADFADLAMRDAYHPLPQDWWIGTSDIIGSTQAVARGLYKTVNTVGAAVISAQINAHAGRAFPYVFGGDGASFAVPPSMAAQARTALAAVQNWAQAEFGIGLRVGMVPVSEIRAAGHDVLVARFQASAAVDYAMFAGGGVSWAETQMKAGAHGVPDVSADVQPDLSGLSCRWSHMPSRFGQILSVVILPCDGVAPESFAEAARQVVQISARLQRAGHPAEQEGPRAGWPPPGTRLEGHARRGQGALWKAMAAALFESSLAWVMIKTGWVLGRVDARRYARIVGDNADFRKFDDGLKMTLDCDAATEAELRAVLDAAQEEGILNYGLFQQSEAMMTCIVPSIHTDDHVHFVDGASGGYTQAAAQMKAGLSSTG